MTWRLDLIGFIVVLTLGLGGSATFDATIKVPPVRCDNAETASSSTQRITTTRGGRLKRSGRLSRCVE